MQSTYVRGIDLIASKQSGSYKYYSYNGHGDVVQISNASGTVAWVYDYDAFGNQLEVSGYTGADANPFRYCGEYWDSGSETYYLRARYYNPVIGRFTQEDSVRSLSRIMPNEQELVDPLSLNLYTYAHGNPVMYCDPSGHIAVTTLILIGSIVIGTAAASYTAYQSHKYTGSIDWSAAITNGLSWGLLAYSLGMSAYSCYVDYCAYNGRKPVTEVNFNANSAVNSHGKMSDGLPYSGIRNKSADFVNGTRLTKHYEDHGVSMGYKNETAYSEAANTFLTKNSTSTTLSFTSNEG